MSRSTFQILFSQCIRSDPNIKIHNSISIPTLYAEFWYIYISKTTFSYTKFLHCIFINSPIDQFAHVPISVLTHTAQNKSNTSFKVTWGLSINILCSHMAEIIKIVSTVWPNFLYPLQYENVLYGHIGYLLNISQLEVPIRKAIPKWYAFWYNVN